MSASEVGALAHEISYWGWVDAHTCLTLGGELVTVGVLSPSHRNMASTDRCTASIDEMFRDSGSLDAGA